MQSTAAQVQRLMQLSAFAGRIMCDAYQAGNRHRAYHFMRKMYHFTKQARIAKHGEAV